ncbi:MAG: metal-dependent phosphohydrolase [Alphaproteobacteria bacterium]|nr:metal-dependent phosphohydrolase [Alphaproteobacteria bacterium]
MADEPQARFAGSLPARFAVLWQRLGVSHPDVAAAGARLIVLYSDPARAYHNQTHLQDVLDKLDWAKDALGESGELDSLDTAARQRMFDTIELALFYHDAVYDARAKDNEAQSRDLMRRDAQALGLDPAVIAAAARLIDLTAHHEQAQSLDERIMADCDLAILGADETTFKKYDNDIRREYAHVPAPLYAAGRAKVLHGFLQTPQLFKTAAFAVRYDAPARRNLRAALAPQSFWQRLCRFLGRPTP